jgi:hypothetical protein
VFSVTKELVTENTTEYNSKFRLHTTVISCPLPLTQRNWRVSILTSCADVIRSNPARVSLFITACNSKHVTYFCYCNYFRLGRSYSVSIDSTLIFLDKTSTFRTVTVLLITLLHILFVALFTIHIHRKFNIFIFLSFYVTLHLLKVQLKCEWNYSHSRHVVIYFTNNYVNKSCPTLWSTGECMKT